MHWSPFTHINLPLSLLTAYIPVIATVITCAISLVLARATLRYAETTDRSLALAREEFEREWSPELHIKLERVSDSEARIVVTNLAKISVLLQMMQIRRTTLGAPFTRQFLNEPLVGGMTWTQNIGERLLAGTVDDFNGQIAASITFYAGGRLFRTDWFRFQTEVRGSKLLRLDAVNIAARRVRVLESRKGEEIRRELATDIAANAKEQTTEVK
jgi:cell division protein FtsL